MTYIPPKAKRRYIGGLFTDKGKLISHLCCRCKGSFNTAGIKDGYWFEEAYGDKWAFVCRACYEESKRRRMVIAHYD